jgi:anti-anti-sigma regulatory factor
VGIFSLFGKKDRRQATPDDKSSRSKESTSRSTGKSSGSSNGGNGSSGGSGGNSGSGKSGQRPAVKRDAQAALATALKIDAIESEMSSDFLLNRHTLTASTTPPKPADPAVSPAPRSSAATPASTALSSSDPSSGRPAPPQNRQKPAEAGSTPARAAQKTDQKPVQKTAVPSPSTSAPKQAARQPEKSSDKPRAKPVVPSTSALDVLDGLPPLSDMGTTTQFLLDGSSALGTVAVAESEVAAVVEEAAIMFANGQNKLVEHLLRNAILDNLQGEDIATIWLMLFDLYQITGKQQDFDNLSIEYASRFERSPPAWMATTQNAAPAANVSSPTVPFSGRLDATSKKHVERVDKMAETYRALRLEFVRVTDVDPAGCQLLLDLLLRLQKSGHELVLVAAPELAEKIRATLEVGRREDTEPAWLLLMEVLRLLNLEKQFEEASIDYCVTFEVSPPAFVAPKNKITTAASASLPAQGQASSPSSAASSETPPEGFRLPPVIEGRIDNIIVAIVTYSDEHSPAIIDCSGLNRIDFAAAGRLLTGLAPFCGNGKSFEFHGVNHLVAALFNVIGLKDIVRIVPRKS